MKTIIKKTVRIARSTKRRSSTVFFVTDAGNVLRWRKDLDIWRIFNPAKRKWEEPSFDIGEVFSTLPISKEKAAKLMKNLLKSTNSHPYEVER